MQKCFNEELRYLSKNFKKYPWILLIIILIVASGIALFTVSLLCNVKFSCTNDQQNYTLLFGLNICLISATFFTLPCLIVGIINCIYYDTIKEPVLPLTTKSPLSSNAPSPQRSRSNSKENRPPSPQIRPIPKHGMKSFKEYHSGV